MSCLTLVYLIWVGYLNGCRTCPHKPGYLIWKHMSAFPAAQFPTHILTLGADARREIRESRRATSASTADAQMCREIHTNPAKIPHGQILSSMRVWLTNRNWGNQHIHVMTQYKSTSAVKTVAAWRQCHEESYRKVRKVIEHVHIPSSFLLITFPTFPQKVLLSFVPQFFPFIFLTFPNNFPHFFSFFLRTGLTVLLTFHHCLYYFHHVSS